MKKSNKAKPRTIPAVRMADVAAPGVVSPDTPDPAHVGVRHTAAIRALRMEIASLQRRYELEQEETARYALFAEIVLLGEGSGGILLDEATRTRLDPVIAQLADRYALVHTTNQLFPADRASAVEVFDRKNSAFMRNQLRDRVVGSPPT
jgi:hypothetical protein